MDALQLVTVADPASPVLRQRARAIRVITPQIRTLAHEMFRVMREAEGVGLAANQVGVARRLIVLDVGEEGPGPVAIVNPRIVSARGDVTATEACLSIPGLFGDVARAARVRVRGRDLDGRPVSLGAEGMLARAIQHEVDHLNGVLFVDRVPDGGLYEVVEEDAAS